MEILLTAFIVIIIISFIVHLHNEAKDKIDVLNGIAFLAFCGLHLFIMAMMSQN